MIYIIINPSDPYTLETDDFEVATVACWILGQGAYGLDAIDKTETVPIFLFGGSTEWTERKFSTTPQDLVDRVIEGKREALIACLEGICIGSVQDRRMYESTLGMIEEADRRQEYHTIQRTSMNDIGGRAWEMAKALKDHRKEVDDDH